MSENKTEQVHNNVEEIYKYTEKEIDKINKNIDGIGTKLTSTLGFSGVLMKFVGDIANNKGTNFYLVVVASFALSIGIGCCIAGLRAKDTGATVKAKALLGDQDWWYFAPEEEYRLRIIRQWHINIEALNELLDYRRRFLNIAMGMIAFVAILFGLSNIISAIH